VDEDTALTTTEESKGPALTLERRARILKVLKARAEGKGMVKACEEAGIVRQTWHNWEKAGLVRQALTDEKGEVGADLQALIVSEMRGMVQGLIDLARNGVNEMARIKAFQILSEFYREIQAESQRDLSDFFGQYEDKYGPERQKMPQMTQFNIGQVVVQGQQQDQADDGEVLEGEATPVGEDEQGCSLEQ
jgi:hypothetical protein